MAEFNFSETEIVGKYSFAKEMGRDKELDGEAQDFQKKNVELGKVYLTLLRSIVSFRLKSNRNDRTSKE